MRSELNVHRSKKRIGDVVARSLFGVACLQGCAPMDGRESVVVEAMVRADLTLLRNRPELVAAKYAKMASDPFAFYRGSLPIFQRDALDPSTALGATRFGSPDVLVLGAGDAHVENFGTLRASDGSYGLEPNDFDAADRYPYHWDLRRLATSLVLALDGGGAATEGSRRTVATECIEAYAVELATLVDGGTYARVTEGGGDAILDDAFRRSTEGAEERSELAELTHVSDGRRRLLRGALDADPSEVLRDLPPESEPLVAQALARYRESLAPPPAAAAYDVLDAAQQVGSGVASYPRLRVLALVEGPTVAVDDDVVLELKELSDSPALGWREPGPLADDVSGRVRSASLALWTREDADPSWSFTQLFGFPIQVRVETAAHRTLRVRRFTGTRGTVEALTALSGTLGRRLAAMHARSEGARSVVALYRRDATSFVEEHAEASIVNARVSSEDFVRFKSALGRLGPTLGVAADLAPMSAELTGLFSGGP